MQVPTTVFVGRGDDEFVTVQVGQHLWPELGARMQFLLDYPHGCVEQTTSGTLPLLAAKDILPRIGFTGMTQEELDKRIDAGLKRLATMRTEQRRPRLLARRQHPERVRHGLRRARAGDAAKRPASNCPTACSRRSRTYLQERLLSDGIEAEVQAVDRVDAWRARQLPASSADALFDRKRRPGGVRQGEPGDRAEQLAGAGGPREGAARRGRGRSTRTRC
jgi:hypothetical protein